MCHPCIDGPVPQAVGPRVLASMKLRMCAIICNCGQKKRGRSNVELRPHTGRWPAGVRDWNCTRDGQQ
eukprot:13749760-Alexandrium_andersonii.AAC.1